MTVALIALAVLGQMVLIWAASEGWEYWGREQYAIAAMVWFAATAFLWAAMQLAFLYYLPWWVVLCA